MVKLSDIDLPMIFKDKLLFSSGMHNNLNITPEELHKSFNLTNWEDQRNRSLFLSHSERDAESWLGRITNPYIKNGELYGDLEVHDANLAMKLGPGKAPIGISAEIRWPPQYDSPTNFTYRGFAMVPNPEVPDTMINFSKKTDGGYNTAKIHTPFRENEAEFSDGVITTETARGSPMAKEEPEEVKEDSNLMSAERGLNKEMENNANNVEPEVKEETVEEVKEEAVEAEKSEEPAVEEEVKEEAPAEEVEESKEAEFAKFNDKFEDLSTKVKALEDNFAKFSEESEKSEEPEEEAKEASEEPAESPAEEVEEEVVAEEVKEEKEEEAVAEEEVEEPAVEVEEAPVEEEAKAEFSALAKKIDELEEAISKKEAAPMSTAEFRASGDDNENDVIDRLTNYLKQ